MKILRIGLNLLKFHLISLIMLNDNNLMQGFNVCINYSKFL